MGPVLGRDCLYCLNQNPQQFPMVLAHCGLGCGQKALKHSLPTICRKRKWQECLGLLTKRYWSTGGALTKCRNAPSCTGLGKLNLSRKLTEQPDAATKAQLREEGKERQEELKALELKGD